MKHLGIQQTPLCLALLLALLCCTHTYGQALESEEGRFEVSVAGGCAPLTVTVTNLFPGFDGTINYIFEGGATTTDTIHTFDTAGTYVIQQFGAQSSVELEDRVTITIFDPLEPEFNVVLCNDNSAVVNITDTYYDEFAVFFSSTDPEADTVTASGPPPSFRYADAGPHTVTVVGLFNGLASNCGQASAAFTTVNTLVAAQLQGLQVTTADPTNGQITLNYTTQPNINYVIEATAAGTTAPFSEVQTITNASITTLGGFNTTQQFYCFRITAVDGCSGTRLFSDTICSPALTVNPVTDANQVAWNGPAALINDLTVLKNGNTLINQPQLAPNLFVDSDVQCNDEHCYSLSVTYTNGLTATVAQVCTTAISSNNPPPINHTTATVNGSQIDLGWDIPTGAEPGSFIIQRRVNDGTTAFTFLDSTTENTYTDPNVNPNQFSYCYRISYTDVCGNPAQASIESCTMLLRRGALNGNNLRIFWNDYTGWLSGVNLYTVVKRNANGGIIRTLINGLSTNFNENVNGDGLQRFSYQVRAVSNIRPFKVAESNIIEVDLQADVLVPNAFSPNRDALNEELEVFPRFVTSYRMYIYNRWGELIYSFTQDERPWNGRYNNNAAFAPPGTYVYNIVFIDTEQRSFSKSGAVLLITN